MHPRATEVGSTPIRAAVSKTKSLIASGICSCRSSGASLFGSARKVEGNWPDEGGVIRRTPPVPSGVMWRLGRCVGSRCRIIR